MLSVVMKSDEGGEEKAAPRTISAVQPTEEFANAKLRHLYALLAPVGKSIGEAAIAARPAIEALLTGAARLGGALAWWNGPGQELAVRAFLSAGYPASHRLKLEDVARIARVADADGIQAASQLVSAKINEVFAGSSIQELMEPWWSLKSFASRRKLLDEAAAAHDAGLYGVAILTWMSQFEAIVLEVADYKGWQLAHEVKKTLDDLTQEGEPLWSLLPRVIADLRWNPLGGGCASFGQDGSLAGTAVDYCGTKANSERCFIVLDELYSAASEASQVSGTPEASVGGSAKGAAQKFLSDNPSILSDLSGIPHLGILDSLVPNQSTKYDYVCAQMRNMLLFKDHFRGLGLGCAVGRGDGENINSQLSEETRLVLLQLWALLQSWGHLFGTYATERALLWALKKEPHEFETILSQIDPLLQRECREIYQQNRWYSVADVTTSWRLSNYGLDEADKKLLVDAHRLYLNAGADPHLNRLKVIFKGIQKISYLSIHSQARIGTVEMLIQDEGLMRLLLRRDGIKYQTFSKHDTELWSLLEAIDEYHYATFFTGDEASGLVLRHLQDFKNWWNDSGKRESGERSLANLFSRPRDWSDSERLDLRLAIKLKIPLEASKWIEETQSWYASGVPWPAESNFYLAFPPQGKFGDVSVYGSSLCSTTIHHIAVNLARLQEKHLDNTLSRSVGAFILFLLGKLFKPDIEPLLEPVDQVGDVHLIGIVAAQQDAVHRQAVNAAYGVVDLQRKTELVALCEYLKCTRLDCHSVRMTLISKLDVMDRGNDQNHAGEIDGLVCDVSRNHVRFHFIEVKKKRARSGTGRQLKNLAKLLVVGVKDPSALNLKRQKGSVLISEVSKF